MKRLPPARFETVVLELMTRLGYGGLLAAEHRGRSGDGGVDGLIREDRLGLDVIYVQAKRWEGTVGSPVVREFLGALDQGGAKKGVLITTGRFSKDAAASFSRSDKKISLIGGDELARLMIEHDLGVTPVKKFAVKRLDSDFFAEEDE